MRRFVIFILTALIFSGCSFSAVPEPENSAVEPLPELTVTVLDIGKADSILIRVQDKAILIDAGETTDGQDVCAMLAAQGVYRLEYLILTHLDKDHIGGAAEVISGVQIGQIIQSPNNEDSREYSAYLSSCKDAGHVPLRLTYPLEFSLCGAHLRLLPPEETYEDDNDYSIMTQMQYGDRTFLFAGDAVQRRLEAYLRTDASPVDFLKVPHHGRAEAVSALFFSQLQPEYAVITCSKKNPPDTDVLTRLAELGTQVFLTEHGTVTVVCDGKSLVVTQ